VFDGAEGEEPQAEASTAESGKAPKLERSLARDFGLAVNGESLSRKQVIGRRPYRVVDAQHFPGESRPPNDNDCPVRSVTLLELVADGGGALESARFSVAGGERHGMFP